MFFDIGPIGLMLHWKDVCVCFVQVVDGTLLSIQLQVFEMAASASVTDEMWTLAPRP
jgi:hypothetical protein